MPPRYFHIRLRDPGFNPKTAPLLNRYLSKYIPIDIDERQCTTPASVGQILEPYNDVGNVIVLYQHIDESPFKFALVEYLNEKPRSFRFFLFTYDFWRPSYRAIFRPKHFKVITWANSIAQLDHFLCEPHAQWADNFVFGNLHCCYNESFLEVNRTPIPKLLVSGSISKRHYPERLILHNKSRTNRNICSPEGPNAIPRPDDIASTEFAYNRRLNTYFACFSSGVYWNGIGTHTGCVLLKTFEILGAGSLLVMPLHEEKLIAGLGLKHMVNCCLLDFNKDIDSQVGCIFKHVPFFDRVRRNGQAHAKEHLNEQKKIAEVRAIIEAP